MPLAPSANNYLLGIDKQTDETTVTTIADYAHPVYSSTFMPQADERRIQVTDASAVQGDSTRGPVSWAGTAELPCYADSVGRWLQAVWPTDTITGAGPTYTHTYSNLGATPSWFSIYTDWAGAGAFEQRFSKGVVNEFAIVATADESPGRLRVGATGQDYSVTAWTNTLTDDMADGFFTLQHSSASIEADYDTPNVNPSTPITNVQSVELSVVQSIDPVPTADGVTVRQLSRGVVQPQGTATLIWDSWDTYRASWYGAVAGTTASNVDVKGALSLNFRHTVNAAWTLEFYVPAVQFLAASPEPDPAGGVLTLPVTLNIQKPTTGSHIQPILVNGTTPAY